MGPNGEYDVSSKLMPIERIPDWERRLARQDAFWECAVIDRPVVSMVYFGSEMPAPWPADREYAAQKDRWLDTERVVEEAVANALNMDYMGDALPYAWPNLGPEVFSAFFGLEMEYTADTSWAVPIIEDWSEVSHVRFSEENPYWRKLIEMTDALLEAGKGIYYTGLSDLHPGGDAVAGFRDPVDLNTDLLLTPGAVRKMVAYMDETFAFVYEYFHKKLTEAGQPIALWPGIVSSKKWHVPSNDFSCMISNEMFRDFFLPSIAGECAALDASIYHLDGPAALRHLDTLLDIPELSAIQWIYGAGNGQASDWLDVYQRCQAAGKGIQILAEFDELDTLMENLRPEGVWLEVGVGSRKYAEEVLRRVSKWTARGKY